MRRNYISSSRLSFSALIRRPSTSTSISVNHWHNNLHHQRKTTKKTRCGKVERNVCSRLKMVPAFSLKKCSAARLVITIFRLAKSVSNSCQKNHLNLPQIFSDDIRACSSFMYPLCVTLSLSLSRRLMSARRFLYQSCFCFAGLHIYARL